jgi:HlyD family secretion protein
MFFRETPIQPGAKVMEQQLVVRLPETTAMKAVARIGEHQAVKLRVDPDKPMRATVRIVGRPEPIGASVTKMSVLSDNQQRWWNPDLKEFPVDCALDATPQGLKPGSSCSVEILVQSLRDVLAVPVGSIYTQGGDSWVFVRDGSRFVPTKVKIGQSNDTHVQVTEGLSAGQQVVMLQVGQGRELLGLPEETPAPTTQPDEVDPEKDKPAGLAQVPKP